MMLMGDFGPSTSSKFLCLNYAGDGRTRFVYQIQKRDLLEQKGGGHVIC